MIKLKGLRNENFAIIGSTVEEAELLYPAYIIRVAIQDGESVLGTAEYVPNRINVEIENDIIIKILEMG